MLTTIRIVIKPRVLKWKNVNGFRNCSNAAEPKSVENKVVESSKKNLLTYRHIYPEFLPDPNVKFRNVIREKLERKDMISRRSQVAIPEFYVGSILAVTISDKHSPGRSERFVGICIQRLGCGLRATFLLRNVIDNEGVEVLYELYDPSIQRIEVLRLEKRLDDELLYLRDSYPEYSTFDVNMTAELISEDTPIPVNTTKVKLKPRPWTQRWERKNLQGVENINLPQKFWDKAAKVAKPWEKYDLMKTYMKTIPEEEQTEIFDDIKNQLQKLEITRKKLKRARTFVRPVKLA
ncbi:39S ribosomal protein L19, mitochondrial [Coccinella septempunctata]|uniref:39S ribosomal protein L19, mitochondrial n=1 Tax=Coccinella septempunctata TaxID=41139 RepID=UPI001D07E8DB|nr:39S ribosomal protein L19, mitochondrial [Coccinella septempunctata]